MNLLVLLLFAFFGQANLSAQMSINPKSPVFLNAPAQSTWQVSQAISLANNILLVGQSKNQVANNRMLMLMTNNQGKTEWIKEYPYPPAQAVAAFNNYSVALLNASKTETLLTRLNLIQGEVVWQVPLRKMQGGSLAIQPNGTVAVATENEEYILVNLFAESGKKSWEIKLPKLYKTDSNSKITSLSDGTYAIAGGGKIWGLSENGHVLWQFSSKTEHISWQTIKQIKNGEIVVAGHAVSANLINTKTDIHIWGIAKDGDKILWASLIGEDETQDKVNDFIELPAGELLFLCKENAKNQLIKLDAEHQPSVVYSADSEGNHRLKYLIEGPNQTYTLVGNSFNGNNKQIVLQTFENGTSVNQPKKPSLFLLSIGVGTLSHARNDAETISTLYKQQAGKNFQKVYTKSIIEDSATKAGELAKAFESLSTQAIKNEDLTLIYFSGSGQALSDDYLLYASDFNAATLRSTTIRLSQLIHDLDNLPGRKLIILDACQSGAAQNLTLPKNISILTSATANQASFEDVEQQHGSFTKILVDAIIGKTADANADGYISLVELYQYTAKALSIRTQKDKTQNPTLLHKGDDFIIFE